MTEPESPDDRAERHARDLDLVQRVLRREPDAVAAWLRRMRCGSATLAMLNRRFGVVLSSVELADLAQDCILSVWRRLETFQGRATLETWVHRSCFLELMNRLRRRAPALTSVRPSSIGPPERVGRRTTPTCWLAWRRSVHRRRTSSA